MQSRSSIEHPLPSSLRVPTNNWTAVGHRVQPSGLLTAESIFIDRTSNQNSWHSLQWGSV